jgi:putative methionine-R-sulfoxide reductase with GAF domain
MYDQGRRAMQTLLRLLGGERQPEQVPAPTNLVVRQSCGCLDPLILLAAAESPATSGETLESALSERRAAIVSEMAQALGTDETVQDLEWSSKLIDAFANEPTSGSQGAFLTILNELLRWLAEAGRDVAACQGLLSVLRRQAMPSLLTDERALRRADDLWHQARVLIGGAAERSRVVRALRNQQRIETLRDVGQSLITAVDVLELTDVIARELPRLGIPSGYLSLYENRKAPTERSRLVLAYDRDGRLELEDGGRRFPSRSLAPVGVLSRADRFDMVLEPLYFRENQLGFALLEAGPDQTATCEALRTHVSTALQTILLHEQQRQAGKLAHRRAAQAALINEVGRRASSELDLQSLLSEVVTATQEAFGYYGVMLLLRDETTDCLVLESVAGGYVGVTPKGLRVAIGEGMTGHAAATGQTQISGDVSQNPHYVRKAGEVTQSELSVPIKSGDKVIGVLDLQSDALDAFDETDVVGMETLADQIAVAINNAHLYEAAHQELADRMRVEAELAQRSAQIQALVLPMIETIERVTTKSQERMEAMNRLSGITQESYERMEATNAIIEKVAASANEMMAMIDVIDGIAANVNLLALNATIEAAHAGEYGKGFAVIAAEIRKLSSRTKSNAKDVSRTLRSAIEGIQDSARASEESFRAFREVEANVKEMLSTLQDISNRMADLSESSADILDLMDISSDNNPPTDQETDSGS